MKKIIVFFMVIVFLLAACAAQEQTPAAKPTGTPVLATPDTALATPALGFVAVRKQEGMQALLLRSRPDPKASLAGQVAPGNNGKLLGLNAVGTWALVAFQDQSGWAPVEALDLTVAK